MDISTRQIRSKKVHGNNVDFLKIEIILIKIHGNNVDFSTIEITSKKVRGNNVDFSAMERKYVEKSMWKQYGFFDQWNYVKKSTWKQRGFFDQRNYIKKVRGNDLEICQNLFFDLSTWYRRQIDVDLTWCACWIS